MAGENKITLDLELNIADMQRGWDQVLNYGGLVKKQLNGLFVDTNTFKPFSDINAGAQTAGVGIDELRAKVQRLEQQLEKTRSKTVGGVGLPQFTQLTGNARMAVSSLNYTLQDSGMFFVNWRMGMMSISNNIPMLLQGLKGMKTEADAANKSFKNYIFDSFSGPNSILIWISLFSMAMVALPQLLDSTTESAEKQKKAIDELRDAYKKLTGAELQNRLTTYDAQLAEFESKHPSKRAGRYSSGTSIGGLAPGNISREEYTVTGEARYGSDYPQVQALQKRIELLKETLKDLGKEEDVEKRIRLNREKLEKMNENPKSKNYWKKLVPDATSYNNARVLLDKWVEADQKIYGKDKNKKDKIPTGQELFDQEMDRILPGSLYEALLPLIEGDLEELKNVEIMSDSEVHKLKIMNIEDEWERKRQLADWEVEAAKEKYKNYVNYNEIIAEYEKQAEIRKKEINLDEQKELEKQFEVQKRMFETLADFGRDELINMFDDAFNAGETFAGRFFSKLLSMFLDETLRSAVKSLFSNNGGGIFGGGSSDGFSITQLIPFIPLAKTTSGTSISSQQISTSQAILNKVTTPGTNEIRVVVSQSQMGSSVSDALNTWAKNVNFKFAYNEFRAGIKTYDHRESFNE